MSAIVKMKQRRGTAAAWTSANPILSAGEIGFETDTNKFKIGDGATVWNSLNYFIDESIISSTYAAGSIKTYNTGWTQAGSGFEDKEFVATHNLNENLSDLIVKFFVSSDGSEANAIEIMSASNEASTQVQGVSFYQNSVNEIKVQTGDDGFRYVADDGTVPILDSETWYWKVKVYKITD